MGRKGTQVVFGRVLQVLGVTMMAASAAAFVPATRVYAETASVWIDRAARVVAQAVVAPAVSPAASASPSPAASDAPDAGDSPPPMPEATPKREYHQARGGPLEFGISGSASFGKQVGSSTLTDPLNGDVTTQQNQSAQNLGLYAEVRRRTPLSTFDVRLPLSFGNASAAFGNVNLLYSTPRYSLGYAQQPLNVLGQLAIGGTLRGPLLTLPFGSGEVTFFEGPAYAGGFSTTTLAGVRMRRFEGDRLYELALAHSSATEDSGPTTTLLAGIGLNRGKYSFIGEGAFQKTATSGGFGFQSRLDEGGLGSSWSLSLRSLPEKFLLYGGGVQFGDRLIDLSMQRSTRSRSFTGDISLERESLDGQVIEQTRASLNLGGNLGRVTYGFGLLGQRLAGTAPTQWNDGVSAQVGMPLGHRGSIVLSTQLARLAEADATATAQRIFGVQVQQQILGFTALALLQDQRQTGGFNDALSRYETQNYQLGRTFGKSTFQYSYTISRNESPLADSLQRTPLFSYTRQISPAIQLTTSFGTQQLTDLLNPSFSGRSRVFNVQINAPFSFGSGGFVQGRIDPNLPATITGQVRLQQSGTSAFAGISQGGLPNVLVVLDGTEIQRTDLQGNFQFSFVKAGQHFVRIETASLPRGLAAAVPVVNLMVQGGQNAQIFFQVGDFGAVTGHVYGRDSSGAKVPLPNVLLRVDGGTYSQTDEDGAYGFGQLSPGQHTITIIDNSVPAFANFTKEQSTQAITVQRGQTLAMDFVAEPLGSIAGKITFDPELAPQFQGPVQNAYVVAEPGDHAAITYDDGSFVIDNLGPGTYTVTVDADSLPSDTGPKDGDQTITLGPHENYTGLVFDIGHKIKKVVFSFLGGGAAPSELASTNLVDAKLPPGGSTDVTVSAPESAQAVEAVAFGHRNELAYDKSRKLWVGEIVVPQSASAGSYDVDVTLKAGTAPPSVKLTVDPALPIAILQVTPPRATAGQYVSVRARFLTDVKPGDQIEWQDGTVTTLGKPVRGRIFTFNLKLSLRPLHGTLLTRTSRLPIVIM